MGELTILLTAGAMMTTGPYKALKIAEAALERGHKVNLFCFGEGMTILKKGQGPKRFPNSEAMVVDLIGRGLNVTACRTCSTARGYEPEDFVEGSVFGRLTDYVVWAKRSDRVVHISF
jgi:tRNA 2-thiouridine synthesizing protein D